MGYLDNAGLAHFWGKVKTALAGKQNTISAGDGIGKTGDTLSVATPVRGIVTQAEFDALPEAQKTSGLYVISDGGDGGGVSSGVPKGTIVIWSGTASNIPDGWALCDGQNGTPDLRDRFVLGGGGTHTVGSTGGEATHKLTVDEMPTHNHKISFGHEIEGATFRSLIDECGQAGTANSYPSGGSQPHNNMPPYYALCYIMKTTEDGGGSGSGSAWEVYSTEETRIGTWIDGKPLYQRTFPVHTEESTTTPTWKNLNIPIENVDKIIDISAVIHSSDGFALNIPYSSGTSAVLISYRNTYGDSIHTMCMNAQTLANRQFEATVKYTKTTDEGETV